MVTNLNREIDGNGETILDSGRHTILERWVVSLWGSVERRGVLFCVHSSSQLVFSSQLIDNQTSRDIFLRGKLVIWGATWAKHDWHWYDWSAGMYTKVNKMLLLLVDSQSLLSIGWLQRHSLRYWRNLRYTQNANLCHTSTHASVDRTEPNERAAIVAIEPVVVIVAVAQPVTVTHTVTPVSVFLTLMSYEQCVPCMRCKRCMRCV